MTTVVSATDSGADLALWAATGDRTALDRVLAAAADPAYTQAVRLLGRAADADDATQEALVQLVRSAHRFDPSRPFRPWLARLVHDACCRLLRSDRRRRRHEAEAVMPSPPESEPPLDPELIRTAVIELPEPLRAAVELHYFAGLSQAEAATALGIGEGACAMRLSRARERLRELLRKRGVSTASAVAMAVLAATPAQAAPPALASQIAAQAAAGTLPTTTIPLTTLQTGAWFMATHPIATTLIAIGIGAAVITPFAVTAGEAPAPTPAPVVVPAPKVPVGWSAPARALLPYLDPAAPFRLAIDMQTLRPQLLKAKPFSLLADPQVAALIPKWQALTEYGFATADGFCRVMIEQGRAGTVSMRDRSRAEWKGQEGERVLIVTDLGIEADRIASEFQAIYKGMNNNERILLMAPAIGPFAGLLIKDKIVFCGRDHERFVAANAPWLTERVTAPPAPQPPAAAWFRYDAGPLLARYAALSGPTGDPALVAPVMGPQWRTLKPLIEGTIGTSGDEIVGSVQVTGAGPMSPLVPLSLLMGGTTNLPIANCAAWPMRAPTIGVPSSVDRIASFSIGLTLPKPSQPFTKATTQYTRTVPDMDRYMLLGMVCSAWSGDLALEVRQGAPLPRAVAALGLRPGTNPVEAVRQVAGFLQLPQEPLDQPGELPKTVTGIVAGAQISVTAFPDRLILTWNAELSEWPGIATAAAPAATPACSALVDLPAIARGWWPLVLMAVPPKQRALLPPLPVVSAHLPVWRVAWESTPDGCRIEERGLPLATILNAVAALRAAIEADPEQETQPDPVPVPHVPPTEF